MHSGLLPAEKLNSLQSTCGIHVCPSETEGFGHYINEARGVGAIVVTTDCSPMNELIRPEYGILVPCSIELDIDQNEHQVIHRCRVHSADLQAAYYQVLALPNEEKQKMHSKARSAFDEDSKYFEVSFGFILRNWCELPNALKL
jgi:glycosyltransferase involved in cell wall biosynthesis